MVRSVTDGLSNSSLTSWTLTALLGCLARIFTTLSELSDPVVLWGFILAAALNAVIALQMVRLLLLAPPCYVRSPLRTLGLDRLLEQQRHLRCVVVKPSERGRSEGEGGAVDGHADESGAGTRDDAQGWGEAGLKSLLFKGIACVLVLCCAEKIAFTTFQVSLVEDIKRWSKPR